MDYTIARFFKLIVSLIVLVALGWLAFTLSSTITVLIIAALIAYILDPIASYLEYRGLSRTQATIVIFIVIMGMVAGFIAFLMPAVIREIKTIEQGLGSGASSAFFERIENWITGAIPFIDPESLALQSKLSELVKSISTSLFAIIGSVVSVVTTMVIIPFAVFFLLKDGPHLKKALISVVPNRYFEMVLHLIYKTDQQLGGYLRGQFFDAVIIGILATTAMWILDVRYFVLIGIFAGLTNMIPYVGPLAGAVSAIFVVLFNGGGGQQVLFVAVAFIIIQLMDNVLVQPIVVARSVNLHPLVIIFAVIIGGQFFGILGMLLAVPTAGMIKVMISEFYSGARQYNVLG